MKEIDWKQEFIDSAVFNKKQEKLSKNGAKSLTDTWSLGVLCTIWKKIKGIRESFTSNSQNSFLSWEKRLAKREFYVLIKDDVLYFDR